MKSALQRDRAAVRQARLDSLVPQRGLWDVRMISLVIWAGRHLRRYFRAVVFSTATLGRSGGADEFQ